VNQKFQAPKGVAEYVPPKADEFLAVQTRLRRPAELAGYGAVELPIFEDEALFTRGVGAATDVVSKEMYTFTDRGERRLALRPEGTAGVMRCVIEHGLHNGQLPVKLSYSGPFFRAERPQKGRYRQFNQVGVEAIGSDDPMLDAEVVALADTAFRSLGLTKFELLLTSLGCAACRPAYRERLTNFLATIELDEATRERAEQNPLRVLDDKRGDIQAKLADAPLLIDHICDACQDHYDEVRQLLRVVHVPWVEAPRLVRGLDYYTRTTFEFSHPLLGAQSGIGGGGRYDGLMETLGGPALSGIGYGLGADRALLAREAEGLPALAPANTEVFAIALGDQARKDLTWVVRRLRAGGIPTNMAFGSRSIKSAMKAADRSGARWALIIGDRESAAKKIQVKDLVTGEQVEVATPEVDAFVATKRREAQEGVADVAHA